MPDLSNQLRDYFDAVIERTTVEDVFARSAFDPEPERDVAPRRIRRRPALQAAMAVGFGFGLTMLVAGAMLTVALLAGELTDGTTDVGSGVAAPAGGGLGFGWILAAGLLITGTVTAAGVAARRRRRGTSTTEERDMKTIETDSGTEQLDSRIHTLERRNRWLVVAVAVLLVAAAALGGVLLFADDEAETGVAPGVDAETVNEIDALLDSYYQAWSSGDGDAVIAMMADDGFHVSSFTLGFPYRGEALASMASGFAGAEFERLGTPIIDEYGPHYYVAEVVSATADDSETLDPHLRIIRIVPQGGELKIAEDFSPGEIRWLE